MKIVGLITEYNPFHKGHIYHIEEAKRLSGADTVVAIMSGDFVQRGLPAVCDKYTRCKMALCARGEGATYVGSAVTPFVDAVFELPTYFATSSAERFAEGAVKILAGLGVDAIVYGCEKMGDFKALAHLLVEEPLEYKTTLKECLSEGLNFPAARLRAVREISSELAELLEGPNNILGIEYEKAIIRGGYDIETYQVLRNDEGYHESGSKIREAIKKGDSLSKFLPTGSIDNLTYAVDQEDFAEILFYKLSELSCDDLCEFYEVNEEIAARIKKYEKAAEGSLTKLTELVSAKNITQSAVRRALTHVLLDIHREDVLEYARLLGFNVTSKVMQEIKNRALIPIITKFADADTGFVKIDEHAAEVYNQIVKNKHGINIPDEYHAGVIIV